jgi:hypothetical protein
MTQATVAPDEAYVEELHTLTVHELEDEQWYLAAAIRVPPVVEAELSPVHRMRLLLAEFKARGRKVR